MIECWREGSSSQFRPNITSKKAWGSELNRDWRSGLRKDRLRNWERAGQCHTKCTWSSGPEPHSLQVGSRLDTGRLQSSKFKVQRNGMAQKEKETKVAYKNISGLPFLRELMTSSGSEMGV